MPHPKSPAPPPREPTTKPLPEPTRLRVVALAREKGDVLAAEILGVARSTVSRAGAGLPVRPSVATAIEVRLPAVEGRGAA